MASYPVNTHPAQPLSTNNSLKDRDLNLLLSGIHSDVTIRCNHLVFNVHRAIICSLSEFFRKALNSQFQVSGPVPKLALSIYQSILMPEDSKEGTAGSIDLQEEDPLIVKCMIQYFYTLDYDEDDEKIRDLGEPFGARKRTLSGAIKSDSYQAEMQPAPSTLMKHLKVYFCGNKYLSEGLMSCATSKIKECLAKALPLDVAVVLDLVYGRDDRGSFPFFQALVDFCSDNLDALLKTTLGDAIRELDPQLSLDVLQAHNIKLLRCEKNLG